MNQNPNIPPAGRPPENLEPYALRWPAFFTLLAASFLNLLDVSIINVGIPSIQNNLLASDSQIQWVVEAYLVTYALGLLPFARLGDILGRRVLFLTGMILFILTSGLCGLAQTPEMLVFSRGLQGLSAALMSSQVMAIAQTMFPPKERPRAFPLFGLVGGLSGIAGPLVAGLLLHANFFALEWRLLFLINLPLGLLTLAAALKWVPRCPPHPGINLDIMGVALATATILCLVYPLIEGRVAGWPTWIFLLLIASAPLLMSFAWWEKLRSAEGASTLIPLHIMSNHDFLLGSGALLVFFSALQGFFLVFALFLQQGLGFSPLQTGLSIVPFPVGIVLATFVGARFVNLKVKILAGSLALIATFLTLGALTNFMTESLGPINFTLPLLVGGLGSGLCISSLLQAVMRTMPLKDAGAGSGTVQVVQQVGASIGIAIISMMYFSSTADTQSVAAYKTAFSHTIVYQLCAYLLVGAAALVMKFEQPTQGFRAMPSRAEAREPT